MGHRKKSAPRHGSLAYLPRKRAKTIKGKIKHWPESSETGLLGFGGFKAGMTHVAYIENDKNSPYKDQEIFCPVTILDAPPLFMYGIRVYKRTMEGLRAIAEAHADSVKDNKYLARKIALPKEIKASEQLAKLDEIVSNEEGLEIRGLFASQPHLSALSRKKPDLLEIKIGGNKISDSFQYAKDHFGKPVRAFDVLKAGQVVDVAAVSKGKGTQGPIKRFRVHKVQHKSRKAVRKVGCLGPETPSRICWTAPRGGQMGFHQRTEYNKQIIKISEKGEEINPQGGLIRYGLVKGDYILIKGSVPGAKKRFVRLRASIRGVKDIAAPEITYVNVLSQQMK
nr:50S ribosomal protein L3 [Candidatus Sigynarchaeum springense]MDO8118485.1 50S ribosomal protein L3 [Candidatus Sigynarchaeota archaeon]